MVLDAYILQLGGGAGLSVPSLIAHASPFSKAILLLLLGLSVYSWAVIWNRLRLYAAVERADRAFLGAFRRLQPSADFRLVCEQHPQSLIAKVALAGQRSLEAASGVPETTRREYALRAMDRSATDEVARLERHVGFLGTTGSVSPFIGLLGTVWGVMAAFLNIGAQGSATLVVVAPGIAEALIATVVGLAAAIPAVVAYNRFAHDTDRLAVRFESFMEEFSNILQRQMK